MAEKPQNKEKIFETLCQEVLTTYQRKNADYGDSFGKLRKEYPELAVLHLQEKVNRLQQLCRHEAKVNESKRDTLLDIAGYALMELTEMAIKEGKAKE